MVVDTPLRQISGDLAFVAAKFLLDLCNKCRNLAGISEQNRTLPGERDPPKSAVEETHTKIVFERLDLKCHCRLSQEKSPRGLVKVQVRSNGPKDFQTKIL